MCRGSEWYEEVYPENAFVVSNAYDFWKDEEDFYNEMHRIIRVISTKDFYLILQFDDDECRVYDMKPLLAKGGVFEPLRDYEVFKSVKVDEFLGTVVWPGEVDLCPDTLYMKSKPLNLTDEAAI